MKNTIIKLSILSVAFLTISVPVFAQGPPPATPIDGGLSLLLAAGGIYGLKKIRDSRK
ncbi:MAG: hypothetical protein JXR10_01950 [Cyclobacteriaceae bacterium]